MAEAIYLRNIKSLIILICGMIPQKNNMMPTEKQEKNLMLVNTINFYLLELKDFINLSSSFLICLISLSFLTVALILIVYVPPEVEEANL